MLLAAVADFFAQIGVSNRVARFAVIRNRIFRTAPNSAASSNLPRCRVPKREHCGEACDKRERPAKLSRIDDFVNRAFVARESASNSKSPNRLG